MDLFCVICALLDLCYMNLLNYNLGENINFNEVCYTYVAWNLQELIIQLIRLEFRYDKLDFYSRLVI